MTWTDLSGKTIQSVIPMRLRTYDDVGYLLVTFTDMTSVVICGGYDEHWTGQSENEYPTLIYLKDITDLDLEPIPSD